MKKKKVGVYKLVNFPASKTYSRKSFTMKYLKPKAGTIKKTLMS